MNNTYRHVDIVPLTRLKADLDFFTYRVPQELESFVRPGMLVSVPFRGKALQGVVVREAQPIAGVVMKDINEVLHPLPLLGQWQLDVTQEVAAQCMVSWATVLQRIVPPKPARTTTSSLTPLHIPSATPLSHTRAIPKLTEDRLLVKYRYDGHKWHYVAHQVSQATGQVLIIVPEKNDITELLPYLAAHRDELLVYEATSGKNEQWRQWQAVATGERRIVLGTRSAIFAPCNKLELCIIVDEEHDSHKQEEPNPRYSTWMVADLVTAALNTKLVRMARAPRFLSLHDVASQAMGFYDLDKDEPLPRVRIIDMNHEMVAHNTSLLGLQVQEAVRTNEKSLILLNRKGFVERYRCRDCGHEGAYHALSVNGTCPSCASLRIAYLGKGIEFAAQQLQQLFPGQRVQLFSKDAHLSREEAMALVEHSDIVIATDYALSMLDVTAFGCIVDVAADQQLAVPTFNAQERVFGRLYGIAASLREGQELFVQTREPENQLFSYISNWDLKGMYVHELSQRALFGYPPYARMVRLLCKATTEEEALSKAESVIISLGNRTDLVVGAPYPHPASVAAPVYALEIKLQSPLNNHDYLKKLPCLIDVDPL